MKIDHALNCIGAFEYGWPEGTQVTTGFVSAYCFSAEFRCPCGPEYPTNYFRVGSHPQCPYHGDLIAEVGYVPHAEPECKRELQAEPLRPWMFVCFGVALPLAVVMLLLERLAFRWIDRGGN